jgi:hypothetical protein
MRRARSVDTLRGLRHANLNNTLQAYGCKAALNIRGLLFPFPPLATPLLLPCEAGEVARPKAVTEGAYAARPSDVTAAYAPSTTLRVISPPSALASCIHTSLAWICRRARSRQETLRSSLLTRPARDGSAEAVGTRGASRSEVRRPAARRTQGWGFRFWLWQMACAPGERLSFLPCIARCSTRRRLVELSKGRPASRPPRSAAARRAGQERRAKRLLTRPSTAARTNAEMCESGGPRFALDEKPRNGRRSRKDQAFRASGEARCLYDCLTRPVWSQP